MLVSFSLDKERMRTTVTWLGFRHVRYGVRPHHIPIMGQAMPPPPPPIFCALEEYIGPMVLLSVFHLRSGLCMVKALTVMHVADTGADGSAGASAERPVDGGDGDGVGRAVAGMQ